MTSEAFMERDSYRKKVQARKLDRALLAIEGSRGDLAVVPDEDYHLEQFSNEERQMWAAMQEVLLSNPDGMTEAELKRCIAGADRPAKSPTVWMIAAEPNATTAFWSVFSEMVDGGWLVPITQKPKDEDDRDFILQWLQWRTLDLYLAIRAMRDASPMPWEPWEERGKPGFSRGRRVGGDIFRALGDGPMAQERFVLARAVE
jgi:hypothetical protein